MEPLPPYALVSPVKDEAEHLPLTFASVLSQTYRPVRWVIVDDGSSDGTLQIAYSYSRAVPWISVVAASADSEGERARGGRVVRAFERGRAEIHERHEIVVKLDGDIELPPDYFARTAGVFAADARAGIVGGRVHVPGRGGRWVPERVGRHTVHGAIKAYRLSCLSDFGGLRASMGWDGIDEYGAKARGWKVIPLAELHVRHHAHRGSKQRWWRARLEEGRGARYMGYQPSFLLARACYRMLVERPPLLGGGALLAGWLAATVRKDPLVDDPEAVAALRAEQRSRLRRLARGASVPPDPSAALPALAAVSARTKTR
jgi:poly-beta-1,6-N-acetyl-D-glucosamine synthase